MVELGGLSTLVAAAPTEARVCVVLLHGYGMKPSDLAPFAANPGVPATFLFPQGPRTAPSGGYSWWDRSASPVVPGAPPVPRDLSTLYPEGRVAARALLGTFFRAVGELRGNRPLLLGGFSQGGMLACDYLLHEPTRIDGLAMLSSSRIAIDDWTPRLHRVRGLPALVAHGRNDPDLAFEAGVALRDSLAGAGARVRWLDFDGGHEISLAVWRALRKLIQELSVSPT